MLTWSVIVGVLGVCGTGLWIVLCSRPSAQWKPQWSWLLGLAALFPAWLLAFLGLLVSPYKSYSITWIALPAGVCADGPGDWDRR